MVDDARIGEAGEGAADVLGDVRPDRGHPLHVRLIDDGLGPGMLGRAVVAPGHGGVDHDAFRHDEGGVAAVGRGVAAGGAEAIAEMRVVPADFALQRSRIRVDQQLVRIEAVPVRRIVGPVHAVAVELARPDLGQVAVPDLVGEFGQRDPLGLAPSLRIEEAELDLLRVGGEDGEIDPASIPGRAKGMRQTGLDAQPRHGW